MTVQSKEMAYTMEYPSEKLNFREHFSSLLLSGDLPLTLLELGSLGGLVAAAWLLPSEKVDVKGSWSLKELAAFLCTKEHRGSSHGFAMQTTGYAGVFAPMQAPVPAQMRAPMPAPNQVLYGSPVPSRSPGAVVKAVNAIPMPGSQVVAVPRPMPRQDAGSQGNWLPKSAPDLPRELLVAFDLVKKQRTSPELGGSGGRMEIFMGNPTGRVSKWNMLPNGYFNRGTT
eukprot:s4582_g1.t1